MRIQQLTSNEEIDTIAEMHHLLSVLLLGISYLYAYFQAIQWSDPAEAGGYPDYMGQTQLRELRRLAHRMPNALRAMIEAALHMYDHPGYDTEVAIAEYCRKILRALDPSIPDYVTNWPYQPLLYPLTKDAYKSALWCYRSLANEYEGLRPIAEFTLSLLPKNIKVYALLALYRREDVHGDQTKAKFYMSQINNLTDIGPGSVYFSNAD